MAAAYRVESFQFEGFHSSADQGQNINSIQGVAPGVKKLGLRLVIHQKLAVLAAAARWADLVRPAAAVRPPLTLRWLAQCPEVRDCRYREIVRLPDGFDRRLRPSSSANPY